MRRYIVGTFGMMIANIANEANAFDSKMRAVNTMLNQTNCTAEVKMRVMDFYSRKSPSHMFYVSLSLPPRACAPPPSSCPCSPSLLVPVLSLPPCEPLPKRHCRVCVLARRRYCPHCPHTRATPRAGQSLGCAARIKSCAVCPVQDVYCELPGAVRRELMKARYKDIMHRIPFLRGLEDLVLVKVRPAPSSVYGPNIGYERQTAALQQAYRIITHVRL